MQSYKSEYKDDKSVLAVATGFGQAEQLMFGDNSMAVPQYYCNKVCWNYMKQISKSINFMKIWDFGFSYSGRSGEILKHKKISSTLQSCKQITDNTDSQLRILITCLQRWAAQVTVVALQADAQLYSKILVALATLQSPDKRV